MKTLQSYEFTDAALKVDFNRIIREAEATEARKGRCLPCLIRVTINNSGNNTITLVHRSCFEGFASEGEPQTVNRILNAPRLPLDRTLKLIRQDGELGCVAYVEDFDSPEGSAEWVVILGDFVKELADRVHVKVEVF